MKWAAFFCLAAWPAFAQEKVLRWTEAELRAAATYKVEPEYPAVARQLRLTGTVELEVSIAPDGSVDQVKIVSGNTLLTGSSLQAVRKWRFRCEADGKPAKATGPLRFQFQL